MPNPIFWDWVNWMYHGVMDNAPEWFKERAEFSAFGMGAVGSYALVRIAQLTSKHAVNRVIPGFDERWLPKLEWLCIVGIPVAAAIYSIVDPEAARTILREHQVYTSGMEGVYLGGLAGALQDLHNRSLKRQRKGLEKKLAE